MEKTISFESLTQSNNAFPVIFHYNMKTGDGRNAKFNWHENIEILRHKSGAGYVQCGEEKLELNNNNLIVVNPNIQHRVYSDTSIVYDCIIIKREFAIKNGIDTSDFLFEKVIKGDNELIALFDNVARQFDLPSRFEELRVNAATLSFLAQLCVKYGKLVDKKETTYDKQAHQLVTQAIDYIKANIDKPIMLDDLAETVGVSKYHFTRVFKDFTGYTPMRYVTLKRCEMAKSLLAQKKYTVSQVAAAVGFENQAYFSKVFLLETGVTPKEYVAPEYDEQKVKEMIAADCC